MAISPSNYEHLSDQFTDETIPGAHLEPDLRLEDDEDGTEGGDEETPS
jgi:hypothetical protein